ncbi:MAG: T9SS type A sorting domain-containing protein [Bacteroidota bacterium]
MRNLFSIFFLCYSSAAVAQFEVESISPNAQTTIEVNIGQILINFNEDLAVQDLAPPDFHVFGRWSGPMMGNIQINGDQIVFDLGQNFFHGEWVTVSLSKNLESMSGSTLEHGYQWNFWTKVNPSAFVVSNPQVIELREDGEGQIQSYGAYAGDLNNDETSDLVVVNEISNDVRILTNDPISGYSEFEIMNLQNANKPSTNEGADFNMDGEIDLAIGNTQNSTVNVLFGNGENFSEQLTLEAQSGIRGLAILDFNGDGWMDIATANRAASSLSFFQNDQMGGFDNAFHLDIETCIGETALMAGDFDQDGIFDLALGCFGSSNIFILKGVGNGSFEVLDEKNANANPWMIGIGDIDNDGFLDVVSANSGTNNVSVYTGDGNGQVSSPSYFAAGGFPLAIDLGDLDGDGDLDIACSNYFSDDFTIMENQNAQFDNSYTLPALAAGSCAIFHDHNNDGLMDLTCVDEIADVLFIYTNQSANGLEENVSPSFTIYPNPTRGEFSILSANQNEQFYLYDERGRKIQTLSQNEINLIEWLSSGSYLVRSDLGRTSILQIVK